MTDPSLEPHPPCPPSAANAWFHDMGGASLAVIGRMRRSFHKIDRNSEIGSATKPKQA
jgi:hypothetical protein